MEPSLREPAPGVFARTAANKAADLAAVGEAVPVEDLGAHLSTSALAEPAHERLFDERGWLVPRVLLELVHARFDLQDDFAMRVEHLNNPGIEPSGQFWPNASSPPTLWHQVMAKVLQEAPAVSGQHIPRLQELRALPPQSPASFLLRAGSTNDLEDIAMIAHHVVNKQQAEFADVAFVGLASPVESLRSCHQAFDSDGLELSVEAVSKPAGFLQAGHSVPNTCKRFHCAKDFLAIRFAEVLWRPAIKGHRDRSPGHFEVQSSANHPCCFPGRFHYPPRKALRRFEQVFLHD
jgi:hypothetical protein